MLSIGIPASLGLSAVMTGLAWAQPVADLMSTAMVLGLYLWTARNPMQPEKEPEQKISRSRGKGALEKGSRPLPH